MSSWNFDDPPVWEVGVGAVVDPATLYDHYEVADIHRMFRHSFPRAERQPPLAKLTPFSTGNIGTIQFQDIAVPPARWWFTSEDGRNLLQIQEDFIGRNWRRTNWSSATRQNYPGFDGLISNFQESIDFLKEFNDQKNRITPNPILFDLIYTNLLRARREDGSVRRFRDIFPWLSFLEENRKGAMSISWLEGEDDFSVQVQAHFVGMMVPSDSGEPGQVEPVMRLSLNARGPCSSWAEFMSKSVRAHDYIRERLLALTSPELQATWSR